MVTILKKLQGSLQYLEEVRQHLARLPSIDPTSRTLILTGYPNVGKSSFMNKVTRANVEVQPYPFTTKSIFVGHTDYKFLRWQVLDTPGILDHPLEERNTIEMQSITALAHLRACILFLIDISEDCGYSIKNQVELFKNIKPLFIGKPLLLVATKSDLKKFPDLKDEEKKLINDILIDGTELISLSNITDEGVSIVKQKACDKLLEHRVEMKLNKSGDKVDSILSRIHVSQPEKRDNKIREIVVPKYVKTDDDMKTEKITERDLEAQAGGYGHYLVDFKKSYLLKNPEWKQDVIPEIWDGKNISDFVDPNIEKKLKKLEKEEENRILNDEGNINWISEEYYIPQSEEEKYKKIKNKIALYKIKKGLNKSSHNILPRKFKPIPLSEIEKELTSRGVDKKIINQASETTRSLSRKRSLSKKKIKNKKYFRI